MEFKSHFSLGPKDKCSGCPCCNMALFIEFVNHRKVSKPMSETNLFSTLVCRKFVLQVLQTSQWQINLSGMKSSLLVLIANGHKYFFGLDNKPFHNQVYKSPPAIVITSIFSRRISRAARFVLNLIERKRARFTIAFSDILSVMWLLNIVLPYVKKL